MTNSTAGLFVAEGAAEVAHEWINPNTFDRFGIAMERVELAATLGVTEILPVGGFVACSSEARLLDEGFKQDGAIGVASVPVFDQASTDQGKGARSEIRALYPRQDEEARVVDEEVQVAPALFDPARQRWTPC